MHASTSSAATARRAPAARAVLRNAGRRRWLRVRMLMRPLLLLFPPLRGRACPRLDRGVREGGQQRQLRVPPHRKGERSYPPPASCSLLHFPTASRATAAMAASCWPTGAAPPWTRLAPPRTGASCWRRRLRKPTSKHALPITSRIQMKSASIAVRWRCGRGAKEHCTRSRCRRRRWHCRPRRRPRGCWPMA